MLRKAHAEFGGRLPGKGPILRDLAGRPTLHGEKDAPWGNYTIRWNPDAGWLEINLPPSLAHLANQSDGRYRLSAHVGFSYRGDEVAAQAATGAVRYDISHDSARGRWYIHASWKTVPVPAPSLDEVRRHPVVAIDVNHGHLAISVVRADGNVLGIPATISLELAACPQAPVTGGCGRRSAASLPSPGTTAPRRS